MRFILSFFLLSFVALPALAQNTSPTFNNEIGFSTNIIFNHIFQTDPAPVELLYKYKSASGRYLRLGVKAGLNLVAVDNINDGTNSWYNNQDFDSGTSQFSFLIGFEKRKVVSESKWWINYGIDVSPGYQKIKYNHLITNANNGVYEHEKLVVTRNELSGTGRTFLGVGFNINSRLSVATEAFFMAQLRTGKETIKQYLDEVYQPEYLVENDIQSFALSIQPASSIFFYYRF